MLGLILLSTTAVAAERMSEAAFLAKWADVVTVELVGGAAPRSAPAANVTVNGAKGSHALEGGHALSHARRLQGPTPGGNPFAALIAAIQSITSAWQSIVNAFKSSYSQEIADKEFANGWSKFKESTKVFKGAGLDYAKTDE